MGKKNKILIISAFVCVIILTILAAIGVNYKKKEQINNEKPQEEVKPKITEEYTKVELIVKKEYNNYLMYDNNIAYYYDPNSKHIVYKNGNILENEIIETDTDNEDDYFKFKKYDFYITEDGYYCIKDKTSEEIECFNIAYTIKNLQDSIDYLILEKTENGEKKVYLLNPNTGSNVDLSQINVYSVFAGSMAEDESGNIVTKNYDYLAACSAFEKCGLISYDGKIIIDYIYDFVDYIDKNTIIVTNNEKQGVINYKNEIKLPIQYDYITAVGNYILAVKDFKLTIYNSNYKVITSNIDIDESESETSYNFYVNIDSLNSIYICINEDNINYIYYINNNKLQRKISSKGEIDFIYNEKDDSIKYITFNYEESGNIYFVFYDSDLYEYYKFNKEINSSIDYYISLQNNPYNDDYYTISINYDIPSYDKYYYLDLINSKEINELKALGRHFSNGYTYTITKNKLNIYKETELLNSFDGNFIHLSEYDFIQSDTNGSKIIYLDFQKESREIES